LRTYLRRCPSCGAYSLQPTCKGCGAPARFSPEDHYGVYRRRLKRKVEGERNG
jgi:H/ACA ribonucleoprotein complex subunit 3